MKLVFISNFLSPHQEPLCREFRSLLGIGFLFIATKPINAERLAMGYSDLNMEDYVLRTYEDEISDNTAMKVAEEADCVIIGSASDKYILNRLRKNKITFKYSERILKKKLTLARVPRYVLGTWLHHGRFMKYPLYMLCAGAYTAGDLNRLGIYKNRCYTWGYFPDVKTYDEPEKIISDKVENSILWAGRLIDWKHPEHALEVAKNLREKSINFHMNIIGTGAMEDNLKEVIEKEKLEDCVSMLGAMSPEDVRTHMEKSSIYIFTSDRFEGWGAVLNESMNSCCAVVASNCIGAVPSLIDEGVNGISYKDGSAESLSVIVENLLKDSEKRKILGINAYKTIQNVWNPHVAASRFLNLYAALKQGDTVSYSNGPCSKA